MNIVILGENCIDILKKLDSFGKKPGNKVVSIYGDLISVTNYIKSNELDMLIINNDYNEYEKYKIIDYLKKYRPKVKIALIYNSAKEVVELYNKGIFVNRVINKKISSNELERNIVEIYENSENGDIIISRLLDKFEFNRSSIGYHYIVESLNYCVNAKIKQTPKINKMYEILADEKYNANQINWNIRKALNSMNRLTEKEVMKKYFAFNYYPTPKEFLNRILDIYYKVH